MRSHLEWLESLSPWPEEFGLERMHALLDALGDPQLAYPSIHVVGTNGKTTAARTIEALLAAEGLHVGAYTSPHVRGWSERICVGGDEADVETALERVRPPAERLGATQFEALTAAGLAEFAAAEIDIAVVEAGLGGRLDATNVLRAPVVLLTNVSLEHTEVLGDTREAIAAEKLAVVHPGATVVLGEPEWEELAAQNGPVRTVVGGAREAAETFLGRALEHEVTVALPGRLEQRHGELWDGAHNLAGARWLTERLERRDYVLVVSIMRDKDVGAMLRELARAGRTLVATQAANPRALPAAELASLAQPWFDRVEVVAEPDVALRRARELTDQVLVTGSLYLLADLSVRLEGVR